MRNYLFFIFLFGLNTSIGGGGKNFSISVPRFELKNNRVIAPGFGSILEPGKPWLPTQVLWIAVPPGSEVTRCKLIRRFEGLPDTFSVGSVPGLIREGSSPLEVRSQKLEVRTQKLEEKSIYPDSAGGCLEAFDFRGYRFVKVIIFPFAYGKETRELWWAPDVTINLSYTLPSELMPVDTLMDELLPPVLNFEEVSRFCERGAGAYDYVIVVPEGLQSVVQDFAKWKEAIGYKVRVISWDQIEDPAIPTRSVSGRVGGAKYILAIGEPEERRKTKDERRKFEDCIVGRIPYTEPGLLSSILERTIEFEINHMRKRVLFVKGVSNYRNEDFSGVAQEEKSVLLNRLESIIPADWEYEEFNHEGVPGGYSIINFLSRAKNWLFDDGDRVPEHHEIRLSNYFLCGNGPSFVFAPFAATEFLKDGAVCVVAPDSGTIYVPGWKELEDGGSQSFNYRFLKELVEHEVVGDAFIQAKFWYESKFPPIGVPINRGDFKIWGDPSLNLQGIPGIDIGIVSAYPELVSGDTSLSIRWLLPDSSFSPSCMVRNFGRTQEVNCKIYCEIDSSGVPVYTGSLVLDTIGAMETQVALFPEWSGYRVGIDYRVKFELFSYRDENPENDTLSAWARVAGGDFLVSDTVLNNTLCELGYKGVRVGAIHELPSHQWIKNFNVLFISGVGATSGCDIDVDSVPDLANLYIEGPNLWLDKLLPGKSRLVGIMPPISGLGFSFSYPETTLEWFLPERYDTVFLDGEGKVWGWCCQKGRCGSLDPHNQYQIWCTRFKLKEVPDSLRAQLIDSVMHFFGVAKDSSINTGENEPPSNIIGFSSLPNPFSERTHIKFKVQKEPTKLRLSVYNLAGNLVKKLEDGFFELGEYELAWDGCDEGGNQVVNGIYFLRLQADREKKLLKLIVFK